MASTEGAAEQNNLALTLRGREAVKQRQETSEKGKFFLMNSFWDERVKKSVCVSFAFT
jgi:hypothetical protein